MNTRPQLAAAVLLLLVAGLVLCLPAMAADLEQPALTLSAAPATLAAGAVTTLTAEASVSGAQLTLSRKRAGDTEFTVVATGVTDAAGKAVWRRQPPASTTYRVDLAAGDTWAAAAAETAVGVRPRLVLSAVCRSPLLEDQRVRFTVTVRPGHPAATVQLVRWTADGWTPLAEVTLDDRSKASVTLSSGEPGRLVVRAEMAADASHLAGRSLPWKVRVYDRRNPYGVPTSHPHLILVDLSKYKLYYHEHGNVVRVFDCVLGRPSLPTPKGHFKIYAKDPHMGGAYGPFRMRYRGLYAIHGTNEPWLLRRFPRNYSHGCTRLSNSNIAWLYSRVHVGTPVWNVP